MILPECLCRQRYCLIRYRAETLQWTPGTIVQSSSVGFCDIGMCDVAASSIHKILLFVMFGAVILLNCRGSGNKVGKTDDINHFPIGVAVIAVEIGKISVT